MSQFEGTTFITGTHYIYKTNINPNFFIFKLQNTFLGVKVKGFIKKIINIVNINELFSPSLFIYVF